ncbi:MAG: glycogen synthase, partial [Leptonema sp. (in: Bacteria)]|nr:glycogen synthase [Leptonema sp. (in: bacteria)]
MKQALVVETAWEVCWQLGGIYTVLRSKAPAMTSHLGDNYCLVGPYNQSTAEVEFEATDEDTPFHKAAKVLAQKGIKIYVGRWLITGRPIVVLIDFLALWHKVSEYKYFFWKDHQIDAGDEQEVNDVILFGYQVAEFFQELESQEKELTEESVPIIGHFHEWMGGAAIPILRHSKTNIAISFTTHATLLGRYLASDDPFFYGRLPSIDPHKAAADRGIYNRFAIERAAVHGAHSFTTVSDITAIEAEHLLGRKPDVILPNGLNIRKFAAVHESQNLHQRYKQMIHEFVMGHFFSSYNFDLDNT